MAMPGLDSVTESKRNGLWTFMDDVDALVIPADLDRELKARTDAHKNFSTSAPSYQRNVLRWVKLAKSDATRQKRIKKCVDYAERDARIPQM
ncbi:MAG: YdeI/OmpD-associated family protein [Myxococcota bacterium]